MYVVCGQFGEGAGTNLEIVFSAVAFLERFTLVAVVVVDVDVFCFERVALDSHVHVLLP